MNSINFLIVYKYIEFIVFKLYETNRRGVFMGFIVDEMLEDISKQGYTPDEVKEAVITILSPYFENKLILNKNAMQSPFLTIFSYLIIYNSDNFFSQDVFDVLSTYRKAYAIAQDEVKNVILTTANLMGQKENLMWTVKSNTPREISDDLHEATYKLMKHVGDVLEISTRHEIIELYAILELSLGKNIDYEAIRKRDFGVIIQSILDKGCFENILKTLPNNIKLSDWRNIAYHHTYEIQEKKIKCFYGKKDNDFEISLDELYKYSSKVIKSCNTIDISRRIFLFDNSDMFVDTNKDIITVRDREVMKIGQLRTAFLGQGFKLADIDINAENEEAIIIDLEASIESGSDARLKRRIHCSQFLYNIWAEFPSKRISIIYCENNEVRIIKYSVEGLVCEKISKGLLEFADMIKFIKAERL